MESGRKEGSLKMKYSPVEINVSISRSSEATERPFGRFRVFGWPLLVLGKDP
jgi:hypothetical protein